MRCCTSVCVPALVSSTPTATQIASTQVTPASVALLIAAFVAPEPTCQLVPSPVVATKGTLPAAVAVDPTATQLVGPVQETACNELPALFAIDWRDHESPFQCSTSACRTLRLVEVPTATHAVALTHETPARSSAPDAAGAARIFQALPFHRSVRA